MQLGQILRQSQVLERAAMPRLAAPPALEGLEISAVTADSRKAGPGTAFVAVPGSAADGATFIADAARRGAALVVTDRDVEAPGSVPVLRVANARLALALMAAALQAGQPETVVAVTGTSGKTSVAEFTRQILAALGRASASLGTLGITTATGLREGALTTPGPVELHGMLAGLAAEGITHLAMEASSHGLDQHRLDGVKLSAAAFTNLGRDHMDYHATVDDYFAAKMRLVRELLPAGRPVVVGMDGAWSGKAAEVARAAGHPLISVGRDGETLRLAKTTREGFRQRLLIDCSGRTHEVELPLIGAYQVENALVAAGLALACGEAADQVIAALGRLEGVPGRLEIVGEKNGALVVVDYAHKPEALEAALAALRPFVGGRLRLVFGCGGDRDKGKRPLMGAIAARLAERVIVTDDNPRSEAPAVIRTEILAGVAAADQRCIREIGDRRAAIAQAIADARPGDVVLIAGKGHETGQKIGDVVLPFDDREVARVCLGGEAGHG